MSKHFSLVKRIDTPKLSIFYSLIKINESNEITAFCRNPIIGNNTRIIKKCVMDTSFNIIDEPDSQEITFKGEDPRTFEHNGRIYIQDNYLNDMYLIDYSHFLENSIPKYIKIDIRGKNLTFISHNGVLYFIHYIKPFKLYTLDIQSGKVSEVSVNDDKNTLGYEYRGGTPGYSTGNKNIYYGYGHRTYSKGHDIFKWVLTFHEEGLPSIEIIELEQPENSKFICDPTSVIEINNKKYLITAEAEKLWFSEQDYITNVYLINE